MTDIIRKYLTETRAAVDAAVADESLQKSVASAVELISGCFASGGKILIAGNGGSAADAEHFATEIVGRFMKERKAYPAIALSSSSSFLTAWSNDYRYEGVFARQLEAFGKKGDVFIGISTSGNSRNLIRAVDTASKLGLKSVSMLGNSGGELKGRADIDVVLTDKSTPHIQEVQIALIHIICQEVEKSFPND